MATTNSTNLSLNLGYTESFYTIEYHIITGNMADSAYKVVKNKLQTGRVFNNTYTMTTYNINGQSGFLEAAALRDNNQAMGFWGDEIDSSLQADKGYAVWGQPNKWVYDTHQNYNNCGVVSALNVLSIAGAIDIINISKSEYEALTAPRTETTTGEFGQTVTKTVTPKITGAPTEDEFTLWSIKNDYCNHTSSISEYKSINDIDENDGGSYFYDIGAEDHLYFDPIRSVNSILGAYGISSSTQTVGILEALSDDYVEHEDMTDETNPNNEDVPADNDDTFTIRNNTGNVNIISNNGQDTIYFADITRAQFENREVVFIKKEKDLLINYSGVSIVTIKDYYPDSDEETQETGSCITKIQFKDTNELFFDDYLNNNFIIYDEDVLETNRLKYGDFCVALAQHVQNGEGIILQGSAEVLGNVTPAHGQDYTINHAITLVGAVTDTINGITDVSGFFVVDSGGWLSETGEAQFISVELLRDFMTAKKTSNRANTLFTSAFVCTDENIKAWADNLNIIGNHKRNTIYGNSSANMLDGRGDTDRIFGGGGNDTIYGGEGNDYLYGEQGDNVLYGGTGNDTYGFNNYSVGSDDFVIPGAGKDTLRFEEDLLENMQFGNNNGSLVITYNDGKSTVTVKDYFSKSLYNAVYKLDDMETIARAGADNGESAIYAYKLYDEIITQTPLVYDKYVDATKANNIKGTKFNDFIFGAEYNDTINAGAGADTINGGAGSDVIKAGAGNDTIYGSYGNDKISGEAGYNVIKYEDSFNGNDTINSGKGEDHIELTSKQRSDLIYTKKGKNLVITYDKNNGSSITITNYFGKKGKTSVKDVKLQGGNDVLDLVREYGSAINSKLVANQKLKASSNLGETLIGNDGHDTITGKNGDDTLKGGLGDDIIKGGKGDDIITGGLGNDKLYGEAGDNKFIFETITDGIDTIYASGKGEITLDFTSVNDLKLDGNYGFVDGYEKYHLGDKNYAFTKSGNDLIIDYALGEAYEGMSTIRLSKYFKSKNTYTLKTKTGTLNLADASIYFEGNKDKKNKITGTSQNDIIYGGDKNDTIKGGKGNDTIYGGLGNDNITGGAGDNTIVYNYNNHDGADTINLTKGENLDIKIVGDTVQTKDLSYKVDSKGNLLISCKDEKILTLKNFGKKDVTTASGSVNLYLNNVKILDLREDCYLPEYTNFSKKKSKYTGNWHSEVIDARELTSTTGKNNKGVSINGGAGDDTIYGSDYNDTLKGGNGDDMIIGGYGKNNMDGGNGSDFYEIFGENTLLKDINKSENDIIKDTGKGSTDNDTVKIKKYKSDVKIWFNIDKNGKASSTLNVYTNDQRNKATISGVETVQTEDGFIYNYDNESLKSQVANWLTTNGYKDVSTALSKATVNEQNNLLQIFTTGWTV